MLGATLRVLPLRSAEPYMAYVDEGNFLHAAFDMVRDGKWDPPQYLYPPFPRVAVAAASTVVDRVSRLGGGTPLRDRIPKSPDRYDELEPFAFLLAARVLSAAVGILIVILTGVLAERLVAGSGAVAALVAALVPALVIRGSIASVDSYVTVAVLGCLYFTDRSRTSTRPYLAVLAAGAFAGVACASKYPAVIVFLAPVTTTVLLSVRAADKAKRLAAAAAGLPLGALLGMPIVWRHLTEIRSALSAQKLWYQQLSSDLSLWRQALVHAESDMTYAGPELGILFVLLSVFGLAVGLRRREILPTLLGWCAFAGASFLLYGTQHFRPFRNLMPVVPIACIAVAFGYEWIRARLRSRRWCDALALGALVLAFGLPMARWARDRRALADPRRQAVDWIAARSRPEDGVVYLRDLAILDGELARLPAGRWPTAAKDAEAAVTAQSPRFLIGGVVTDATGGRVDVSQLAVVRSRYRPVFRAGATPTVPYAEWWHGNDQIVDVLERRESAP